MAESTRETDEFFMDLALEEARKAEAAGEVPIGAVVVKNGEILSRGFNQPISTHDPTAHAETVALRAASLTVKSYRLDHVTLYVTLEPCAMCAGAMIHARVSRLVFGARDPKAGACGSVFNIATDLRLNPRIDLVSGVREKQCAEILRNFFERRREKQ